MRYALELKPDLSEAAEALREVESLPAASIHIYTLLIIICLVCKIKVMIPCRFITDISVLFVKKKYIYMNNHTTHNIYLKQYNIYGAGAWSTFSSSKQCRM